MDAKALEFYVARAVYQQALLGAAVEAIFISHPNKEELAKIFSERSDAQLSGLPRRTELEKKTFASVEKARESLMSRLSPARSPVDG